MRALLRDQATKNECVGTLSLRSRLRLICVLYEAIWLERLCEIANLQPRDL